LIKYMAAVIKRRALLIHEQAELPANLLDYFLWSKKSNINQSNINHYRALLIASIFPDPPVGQTNSKIN